MCQGGVLSLRKKLLDTFGAQVSSDHERYPADVKCLGFLYLYVGRYPRNNASRNNIRGAPSYFGNGLNVYCHLKTSDTAPSAEITSQSRPVSVWALCKNRSSHVTKKSAFAVDASAYWLALRAGPKRGGLEFRVPDLSGFLLFR